MNRNYEKLCVKLIEWNRIEEASYLFKLPTNLDIVSLFTNACFTGNLTIAQRLYQIQPTLDISAKDECVFRRCCYRGHINVAQWLYQIKPTLDISVYNEQPFMSACMRDHLQLAQWLYQLKPAFADNDEHYYVAHFNNSLQILQWVHSLYPHRYKLKITILEYFDETVQSSLIQEEDKICPICIDTCVTVQTYCKHNYCTECLTKWVSSHQTCPYCRDPITKVFQIV